ncbi:MAG: hypothetical protein R3B93_20505 [Bacteroidia bacterium]
MDSHQCEGQGYVGFCKKSNWKINAAFYQENSYQLWDYETQKQILQAIIMSIRSILPLAVNPMIFTCTLLLPVVCVRICGKNMACWMSGVKVPDDDAGGKYSFKKEW